MNNKDNSAITNSNCAYNDEHYELKMMTIDVVCLKLKSTLYIAESRYLLLIYIYNITCYVMLFKYYNKQNY